MIAASPFKYKSFSGQIKGLEEYGEKPSIEGSQKGQDICACCALQACFEESLESTRGETRTLTSLRTLDFESSASANSATLAWIKPDRLQPDYH